MKSLLAAIRFLTVLPLGHKCEDEKNLAPSLAWFPAVGLLLGLGLAAINHSLGYLGFNDSASNAVLVVCLILLTGGIHLDGLSDTFDALSGGKNKEECLRIMRDPHVGVMGVLSIAAVLLLKISLLSCFGLAARSSALILLGLLSRWTAVFSMFEFPYARQEGKAKIFMQGVNLRVFLLASAVALAGMILTRQLVPGLAVGAIAALAVFAWGRYICRRIGGITGDTLGATIEMTEVLILVSLRILGRVIL